MIVGPHEAALKIKLTNIWKGTSTVSDIILLELSVFLSNSGVDVDRCHPPALLSISNKQPGKESARITRLSLTGG